MAKNEMDDYSKGDTNSGDVWYWVIYGIAVALFFGLITGQIAPSLSL